MNLLAPDIDDGSRTTLLAAARAAVAQAFLTKEGGVRYGAAALTSDGSVFSSGQYSSFNHSTNIHAEQGVLLIAAMQGRPDVIALAVASTGSDPFTRPCGVCRQVMLEHAARTGCDFTVFMVGPGDRWESSSVSALLPHSWTAASQERTIGRTGDIRQIDLSTGEPWTPGDSLETGDHVLLDPGAIALIWDPAPWTDVILVKIKYRPNPTGGWLKLPHSFTEALAYERELADEPGLAPPLCGAPVACVRPDAIRSRFPTLPAEDLPPVLAACIAAAGIHVSAVRISGSRSTGMHRPQSDLDLIVRASPEQAARLRQELVAAMRDGRLAIPGSSGTWRLLDRLFPGGAAALLDQGRFAETLEEGGTSIALILVPEVREDLLHDNTAQPAGFHAAAGIVTDATRAPFKRAEFTLGLPNGQTLRVASYHKAANLLHSGDFVAVRGWRMHTPNSEILLQFHAYRDNIVWFPLHSPTSP